MSARKTCLLLSPDLKPNECTNIFKAYINDYLKANPDYADDYDKAILLKQLREDLVADEEDLVQFFDDAAYQISSVYNAVIYDAKDDVKVPSVVKRESKQIWKDFEMWGKNNPLENDPREVDEDEKREGDSTEVDNISADIVDDNESSGKSIGDTGIDRFDVSFFKLLGVNIGKDELLKIYDSVKKSDNFMLWLNEIEDKYDIETPDHIQGDLQAFWIAHRPENEIDTEDIVSFAFVNLDENQIDPDEDYGSQVGKAKTRVQRFIQDPLYNLKRKFEKSRFRAKNFIEHSTQTVRGLELKDLVAYFPLSSYGTIKGEGDNWWFQEGNLSVDEYLLNQWMIELGNMSAVDEDGEFASPYAIVGITPGSSAEFILTRILDSQTNELFPKDEIIQKLRENLVKAINEGKASDKDIKYMKNSVEKLLAIEPGESVLDWYKKLHYEYRKAASMINNKTKKEGQEWETEASKKFGPNALAWWYVVQSQYLALNRAVATVGLTNFAKYQSEQVKAGYMTQDQADKELKSVMEQLGKIKSQTTGHMPLVTYMSSLIARHEFMQGLRGKDYRLHEKGNPYHAMTRLKLNKSKGLVLTNDTTQLEEGNPDNQNKTLYYNHKYPDGRAAALYYYKDPNDPDSDEVEIDPTTKLGATYNDGFTGSSTASLNENNALVGTHSQSGKDVDDYRYFDPKAQKTVKVKLDADGTSFVDMKHSKQEVVPGLSVYSARKDGSRGVLLWKSVQVGDEVQIIDGNGNIVQDVAHGDSVKDATGEYDISKIGKNGQYTKASTIIVFDRVDERFISTPHNKANETTYGPTQHGSNLNYDLNTIKDPQARKMFQDYIDVWKDLFKQQYDLFNDLLIDAHQDPRSAREILRFIWSKTTDQRDYIRDYLELTNGVGLYHDNFMRKFRSMLANTFLKKGSLQGRTGSSRIAKSLGKGASGTNLILSPDQNGEVESGNVILPSSVGGNSIVYEHVLNGILEQAKSITDKGSEAMDKARANNDESMMIWDYIIRNHSTTIEYGEGAKVRTKPKPQDYMKDARLVSMVNDYIKNNATYVLTYRSPILDISAIKPIRIQEFRNGIGNNIIHHKDDVDIRLVGDYDIDEAGVFTVNDEQAQKMLKFTESQMFKSMEKNASLDYFLKQDPGDISSIKDLKDAMLTIIQGMGLQGMATNMKAITSTLSMHFNKITIGTKDDPEHTVVRPKKLNDRVVMEYAPIDPDADHSEILKLNPDAKLIKYDDGYYRLETTVAHEMLLIVNAATDYAGKKQGGMIINVWGADKDWFIERMFHIDKTSTEDGRLHKDAIKVLRKLKNEYNYSNLKKLRKFNGAKMDLGTFYGLSKGILERSKMGYEELLTHLREQTNVQKKLEDGSTVLKMQIQELDRNEDVMTIDEEVITGLQRRLEERFPNGGDVSTPMLFNAERLEVVHYTTISQLWDEMVKGRGIWSPDNTRQELGKRIYRIYKKRILGKGKYAYVDKELPARGSLSQSQYDKAKEIADLFDVEFYGIFKDFESESEEKKLKITDVAYDEAKFNITKKYINKINEIEDPLERENVRDIFTMIILSGLGAKQNISYLPPLKIDKAAFLSEAVIVSYFDAWEFNLFKRDSDMNLESMKVVTDKSYKDKKKKEAELPSKENLFNMIDKYKKC